MKPKTKKIEAPVAERKYYKVLVDSKTGKALTRFWHACQKCEEAAEDYCKKFGAKYYYEDPKYFAGGVACVAFEAGAKVDEREWRRFMVIDDEQYWVPACEAVRETVEVPSREYQMKDSWDTMYLRDHIREVRGRGADGSEVSRLVMPKISFRTADGQKDACGRPVVASRKMRRAIIAEQKRLRLPVTTVQQIYGLLGARLPEGRLADQTPTFFVRSATYYIGCAYACGAEGLEEITPQIYKMNADLAEYEARQQGN
ncbi:MAG: hypothetical protein J6X07_08795 [Prevotella sp.]|nr:hypothetical protein [Prevotella sp.]